MPCTEWFVHDDLRATNLPRYAIVISLKFEFGGTR